jgi:hypothetical protein
MILLFTKFNNLYLVSFKALKPEKSLKDTLYIELVRLEKIRLIADDHKK